MVSLWLASQSPRRASMVQALFPEVHCKGLDGVDETPPSAGSIAEKITSICKSKADAVPSNHGYDVVLVCDTVLADPDEVNLLLGKPRDAVHAATMLHRLSGRRHQVWSAAGLCLQGTWRFFVEHSVVEIDPLPDDKLVELVLNGSWKGKAGGYDLAGQMGGHARLVDGSEATVLGIPQAAMEALELLR
ncbi:MAG: Maf family protein [Candidatus Poseidoniaceae archaeon]|nr:Maf family protein [Candidatus Poseidoniaceae archaeon]